MLAEREREEKINSNINLVHALARRFVGRGVEYDDLFQAGCVGLIKSVDGFDESRGFAFSTYAVPVILGELKSVFRHGGAVKVSRSVREKGIKALREKENFVLSFGREPTVTELSEILGLSCEETAEVLACNLPALSLTAPEREEFDISSSFDEDKLNENLALKQAIAALESRDKELIRLRFFKEYTQTETAKHMGMTQVQVSRREQKILLKLRKMLL